MKLQLRFLLFLYISIIGLTCNIKPSRDESQPIQNLTLEEKKRLEQLFSRIAEKKKEKEVSSLSFSKVLKNTMKFLEQKIQQSKDVKTINQLKASHQNIATLYKSFKQIVLTLDKVASYAPELQKLQRQFKETYNFKINNAIPGDIHYLKKTDYIKELVKNIDVLNNNIQALSAKKKDYNEFCKAIYLFNLQIQEILKYGWSDSFYDKYLWTKEHPKTTLFIGLVLASAIGYGIYKYYDNSNASLQGIPKNIPQGLHIQKTPQPNIPDTHTVPPKFSLENCDNIVGKNSFFVHPCDKDKITIDTLTTFTNILYPYRNSREILLKNDQEAINIKNTIATAISKNEEIKSLFLNNNVFYIPVSFRIVFTKLNLGWLFDASSDSISTEKYIEEINTNGFYKILKDKIKPPSK